MNLEPLIKYLPENSIHYIYEWIGDSRLKIRIKSKRKTKLGDYRFDKKAGIHQISIDGTMEPYPFFFVMTHEIAHLLVRKSYPENVRSHGDEWKRIFGELLDQSIEIYPEEIRSQIQRHAQNPKASIGADKHLHSALFLDDDMIEMLLDNLEEGQYFRLRKRIFQKGKKRKIRYICRELKTNRSYLISGQAVVDEIINL